MSNREQKEYVVWKSMRGRCNTTTNSSYKHYGAKGITVCEEWDSFLSFKEWCDENNWNSKLELDRIDPDLGYSPDNCRLATRKQNIQNIKSPTKGTSKHKGVHNIGRGNKCWRVRLNSSDFGVHEKTFYTEDEAALYYNHKATEWYGEFARLNVV